MRCDIFISFQFLSKICIRTYQLEKTPITLQSAEGIMHFHSEKEFKICLFP